MSWDQDEIENILENKNKHYLTYKIRKRNGKFRRIDAPQEPLKSIQKDILYKFLYSYRANKIAHGFIKGRSPITNAEMHVGKKYLLKVDLLDFFSRIRSTLISSRIQDSVLAGHFKDDRLNGLTGKDILILTRLLTLNSTVPQGAPTSPALSNIVLHSFDKRIAKHCKSKDQVVTRYADDITISSYSPILVTDTLNYIRGILPMDIVINNSKIKYVPYYRRMKVTGIVVNEKLNVERTKWRNFRARLHNMVRDQEKLSLEEIQRVRGYIEWVRSLNQKRGDQFLNKFETYLKLMEPSLEQNLISVP